MAFGEGFKHMDTYEQLEDGNYRAKIIKAEIKNGSYGYRDVYVKPLRLAYVLGQIHPNSEDLPRRTT